MVRRTLVFMCTLILAFSFHDSFALSNVVNANKASSNPTQYTHIEKFESPSFFTENKGQWPEEVLYMGNTNFGTVVFTKDAVYYNLVEDTTKHRVDQPYVCASETPLKDDNFPNHEYRLNLEKELSTQRSIQSHSIKLSFMNQQAPFIKGANLLPHFNNYFIGNVQEQWGIHCNNYEKVIYTNVWEQIDLVYFFSPQGLKYEFHVHPGGDYKDISVCVGGAVVLSHCVSLELQTPLGSMMDEGLLVYGETSKTTYPAFFVQKNDAYTFSIQCESTMKEVMIIDPTVEWSQYIGGSLTDHGSDIVTDGDGIYLTGYTYSPHMLKQKNSYCNYSDAFIVKLSNDGKIEWTVYFGGDLHDFTKNIAVDISGIYITGHTYSDDLPKKKNDLIKVFRSTPDGFIAKISHTGAIEASVYIGGSLHDYIDSIGIDKNEIYFSGTTSSNDIKQSGNNYYGGKLDAFYGKCTKDFSISWIYYFGGTGSDWSQKIVFNKTEIFVLGSTQSASLPKMINHKASTTDVFITKIRKNGEIDITFCYGGNSYDWGYDAILDEDKLYIAGNSYSTSIPGSFSFNSGDYDFFIAELTLDFDVDWSLLLGASRTEEPPSITHDKDNIYISGTTNSPFFMKSENYNSGQTDIIVSSVSKKGKLNWSCFVGGSSNDSLEGICLSYSDVYLLGSTYSSDLVKKKNSISGNIKPDAFITKIYNTKLNDDEIHIVFEPNQIDFGTLLMNDGSKRSSISVENTGNVNYFGILQPDSHWIHLKDIEFTLPPASKKEFEVWVDSTYLKPGIHNGSILVQSYAKSFIIDVKVEIVQPAELLVYPLELVYRKGKDGNQVFSIGNTGHTDFVGFLQPDSNWIQLTDKEFTLPLGSIKEFEVRVDSTHLKPGIHNGTILIHSDIEGLIGELRVILIIEESKALFYYIMHERVER